MCLHIPIFLAQRAQNKYDIYFNKCTLVFGWMKSRDAKMLNVTMINSLSGGSGIVYSKLFRLAPYMYGHTKMLNIKGVTYCKVARRSTS